MSQNTSINYLPVEFHLTGKNSDNFRLWKLRIKQLLVEKELYKAIKENEEFTKLDENTKRKLKNQAEGIIIRSISDEILLLVSPLTNKQKVKEIWQTLKERYAQEDIINAEEVYEKLSSLKITEDVSIEDYSDRFKKLFGILQETEYSVSQRDGIRMVLKNMPTRLSHVSIVAQKELEEWMKVVRDKEKELEKSPSDTKIKEKLEIERGKLNINNILVRFITEERRLRFIDTSDSKSKESTTQAMISTEYKTNTSNRFSQNSSIECYTCHKKGHKSSECYYNNRNPRGREQQYNSYRSRGRGQQDYRYNRGRGSSFNYRSNRGRGRGNNYSRGYSRENENINSVIAFATLSSTNPIGHDDIWILDSGATIHIAKDRRLFSNFKESDKAKYITLANGSKIQVNGEGEINLQIKSDKYTTRLTLKGVYYVPEASVNLISVDKLNLKGYNVLFNANENNCMVTDKYGNELMRAKRDINYGNLRILEGVVSLDQKKENIFQVTQNMDDNIMLQFHRRFNHLHPVALRAMLLKGYNYGIRLKPNDLKCRIDCEECAEAKIARKPFPKQATYRAREVLELIHSDICGPMTVPSRGGAYYFITFIDDYSRWTSVSLLKSKDEAYDMFVKYKTNMENLTNKKMKALRTDNGKEYVSTKFNDYLSRHGIKHQTTVPYSPQQNGIAERANRTLMEAARSMLLTAKLDKEFWGEAIRTAAYIRNRVLSKAIQNTPYFLWHRRHPNLSFIRVFGCVCFAHIPKNYRGKLDAKGKRCILLGYNEDVKGYRLLDMEKQEVFNSRDVIFFESKFLDSTQSVNTQFIPSQYTEIESANVETDQQIAKILQEKEDAQMEIFNDEIKEAFNPLDDEYKEDEEEKDSRGIDENVQRGAQETENKDEWKKKERPRRDIKKPSNYKYPSLTYLSVQNPTNTSNANSMKDIESEPITFQHAMESEEVQNWTQAMNDEMKSIQKTNTWNLVELPEGRVPISNKWIYKKKRNEMGEVIRYKARLVARGFTQREGLDYEETYSPVVKHSSLRVLLSLAAINDYEIQQMDVKTAYLNGELEHEIYMQQPEGYVEPGKERLEGKLNKSLYGLKQAGRSWYNKIDGELEKINFVKLKNDNCVYKSNDEILYTLHYMLTIYSL